MLRVRGRSTTPKRDVPVSLIGAQQFFYLTGGFMQKKSFRPRRYQTKRSAPNRERDYQYYKMMWQAVHPEATSAEFEVAMQQLAKLAGV